MKTLAVTISKGGVGKTTDTCQLGRHARALGLRVLVVDFDDQVNATKALERKYSENDVVATRLGLTATELLLRYNEDDLGLIPEFALVAGDGALVREFVEFARTTDPGQVHSRMYMAHANFAAFLGDIAPYFDLCIIDSPPAADIGVVGGRLVRQPRNIGEALATVRMLQASGWNYSVGHAQVNKSNFRKYGLDLETAFDPCTNIRVGAKILQSCYVASLSSAPKQNDSQFHLVRALSCYYSGRLDSREGWRYGEAVDLADIEAKAKQTTPPKRFTEATLLTAMEHASGDIEDDDDARQAMAEKGLGTPATRAATIEVLVAKGYIAREGKQIVPTDRGLQLVSQLERLDLELLTSAKLTGEWEFKLGLIDKGRVSRADFMAEIGNFTRKIVGRLEQERSQLKPRQSPHSCPDCGFPMFQAQSKFKAGANYWECSNYPACKTKCDDVNGKPGKKKEKPAVSTEHLCPVCGKGLSFRRGVSKKGPWKMWSCSGYPDCTEKFDDAGGKPVL